MIEEINIDIFKAPIDVLVHGCNCQKTMGAGIAKIIKERFPEAYAADKANNTKGLGDYTFARVKNPDFPQIKFIINLYQQDYYGKYGRQLDYEAFYTGLCNLTGLKPTLSIGFPHGIGCNNAGGSWRVVREMIYDVFETSPRRVLICRVDKPEPA